MTHIMIHKRTITHNDTRLLTHTFLRTLSIAHLHTRRQTHTACHRVCFIMYHCVSYCQCISFRVFLYYSAFLNARYLEHVFLSVTVCVNSYCIMTFINFSLISILLSSKRTKFNSKTLSNFSLNMCFF